MRAVFRLPFRQTEGLIGSVIGLLGLDLAVPDHTTLCRRAETLEVPRPRPRSDGEPVHLLVDSTGLKLCGAGEWLIEKHGTRTRRSWRKLHLGVDADTGQIVAAVLTDKDADDGAQVGPLLDQVAAPVVSFTADGAYDQEGVAAAVAAASSGSGGHRAAAFHGRAKRDGRRPRQRSGTAICSASPSTDARPGRRRPATTSEPASKPLSAGSNR